MIKVGEYYYWGYYNHIVRAVDDSGTIEMVRQNPLTIGIDHKGTKYLPNIDSLKIIPSADLLALRLQGNLIN